MTEPATIPGVEAAEAAQLAEDGTVLLLDVREDDEWAEGHAPGAEHTPLGSLDPASVARDRPVVTVCRSGKRAEEAAKALAATGHEVRNLTGGMQSWAGAGLPVRAADGSSGQII